MSDTINIPTLTRAEAVAKLEALRASNSGHAFTVTFIKRTNGEVRVMNARFGVKKHLVGGTLAYNPGEKSLMGCYDLQKPEARSYRMIDLNSIIALKIEGEVFEVTE